MKRAPFALLLLTGCTVGPNYVKPDVAVPARFPTDSPAPLSRPTDSAPAEDLSEFWKQFRDPELDRLVALALRDNLDLKTAESRLRQARLLVRVAGAADLPQVSATGDVTNVHLSKNAGISQLAQQFGGGGAAAGGAGGSSGTGSGAGGLAAPGSSITTYSVGFDANWEIDLFGGTRRGVEAARAREEAAVWNGRDTQVSLVAEVATTYFELRTAQARIGILRAEIDRQRRLVALIEARARTGLTPELDITRQRTQLDSVLASLPPLEAQGRAQAHALALLLAQPPEAFIPELDRPAYPLAPLPPTIPVGLPSDLLRRRPDIRAAERNLAAATADIGVAVADLYPKFSLTGVAELISTSLKTLLSHDSLQTTATAGLNWPILDFGRRKATVGLRREDREQAYIAYQQTTLAALRDVADALDRYAAEQRRNRALAQANVDTTAASTAIIAQFRTGLTDETAALQAQVSELQAKEQLAASIGKKRTSLISLYKALGGGWSENQHQEASAPSTLSRYQR